MKTPLDALHDEIADNEHNHRPRKVNETLRLIIADYYDDREHTLVADAIRWQVRRHKRPLVYGGWALWYKGYSHFDLGGRLRQDGSPQVIPNGLFETARSWCRWAPVSRLKVLYRKSCRAADEELWLAWAMWTRRIPIAKRHHLRLVIKNPSLPPLKVSLESS